jgi:Macro domain
VLLIVLQVYFAGEGIFGARDRDVLVPLARRLADDLGAESLAVPAFGTGVGGFPLDECAPG